MIVKDIESILKRGLSDSLGLVAFSNTFEVFLLAIHDHIDMYV